VLLHKNRTYEIVCTYKQIHKNATDHQFKFVHLQEQMMAKEA